jgi:hypothetical protein
MFRWHYGLVAVLGLTVGYMGVKGVSLVAWMNAPGVCSKSLSSCVERSNQ